MTEVHGVANQHTQRKTVNNETPAEAAASLRQCYPREYRQIIQRLAEAHNHPHDTQREFWQEVRRLSLTQLELSL
jgi:hypothetical protein